MLPQQIMADRIGEAMSAWHVDIEWERFEQPLMSLGPIVFRDFDDHFLKAQGPSGPWAPRTRQYPWPILIKTGKLQYAAATQNGAGNINRFRLDVAEFGLDVGVVNYAAFHEYGTSRMPARPWCWLSSDAEDEAAKQLLDALFLILVG